MFNEMVVYFVVSTIVFMASIIIMNVLYRHALVGKFEDNIITAMTPLKGALILSLMIALQICIFKNFNHIDNLSLYTYIGVIFKLVISYSMFRLLLTKGLFPYIVKIKYTDKRHGELIFRLLFTKIIVSFKIESITKTKGNKNIYRVNTNVLYLNRVMNCSVHLNKAKNTEQMLDKLIETYAVDFNNIIGSKYEVARSLYII